MGVPSCDGCDECGTTLAEAPDEHEAIAPHDWREEFNIDAVTGERRKHRVCLRCLRREPVVLTVYVDGCPWPISVVDVTGAQLMAVGNVDPSYRLYRDDAERTEVPYTERIELSDGSRFVTSIPETDHGA
jgi:hypothetical protein